MAVQAVAGPGSLISLGISISDVATFYGLAKRVGNWLSAVSGDQEFLELLGQDELDILQRKGLIDIQRFNKRWGSRMVLLENGRHTTLTGEASEKNLDRFSRFTASMVCVIAALGAFATQKSVLAVLKDVLLELLRTTEWGEDIIAAQFSGRVHCWQSAADVRGLSAKAREIRLGLLNRKEILDGFMPEGESRLMIEFLVWLLSGTSATYTTPSSDVAGVGLCLSELGMDILSVTGFRSEPPQTPCRLEYSTQAPFQLKNPAQYIASYMSRFACTTVSLKAPEESLTKFPIDYHTSCRCRQAWSSGRKAAEKAAWTVRVPRKTTSEDLRYIFYDIGAKPERTRTQIGALIEAHALIFNREVCLELEFTLQRESDATLDWMLDQTTDGFLDTDKVCNTHFDHIEKINAFTVFQAFLMGYYYGVFLDLVDLSALQHMVVEGTWGYRETSFLTLMRTLYIGACQVQEPGVFSLSRENVIGILSLILCGRTVTVRLERESWSKNNWCIGVVGKRTLLVKSLLKPCQTLQDVGKFVLLDIDVSGISRDTQGFVRPGIADLDRFDTNSSFLKGELPPCVSEPPSQDVSFHIEVDWEGNPENILLCVRLNGRRIGTINPAVADAAYCSALFLEQPLDPQKLAAEDAVLSGGPTAINVTTTDCLNKVHLKRNDLASPYILHLSGMPRLRYTIIYWYQSDMVVSIAGKDLQRSLRITKVEAATRRRSSYLVITGDKGHTSSASEVPEDVDSKIQLLMFQEYSKRSRANVKWTRNSIGQPEAHLLARTEPQA